MKRVRGRELQRIRARARRADPFCVACRERGVLRPWVQLDHIVPLNAGGGKGEDSDANRQGLCADCHAAKTARDLGFAPKPPRLEVGADGYPLKGKP